MQDLYHQQYLGPNILLDLLEMQSERLQAEGTAPGILLDLFDKGVATADGRNPAWLDIPYIPKP